MLTGKYDVHYVIFELSYPVARERDNKRWVLAKIKTFWGHFCGASPHFMQDRT